MKGRRVGVDSHEQVASRAAIEQHLLPCRRAQVLAYYQYSCKVQSSCIIPVSTAS
jgi:hypothetical protein